MANITPALVKKLRDSTGAGMADCKKALEESNADMEEAIEYLRKKGAASAEKRADREANEGIVSTYVTDKGRKAVISEVTCETDFVARNEGFTEFAEKLAKIILENEPKDTDSLMKLEVDGKSVEDAYNEILAKFSEKIEVGNFEVLSTDGYIKDYIHGGNKLGVLVEVSSNNINEKAEQLVKDIAMQVAAMNPMFIDRSTVTQDVLDKEKALYKEQALEDGKPEEIAQKIADGKINKFFQENCLIEQQYVKDGNKNIKDVLKEISDEAGEEVKINKFIRYSIGD